MTIESPRRKPIKAIPAEFASSTASEDGAEIADKIGMLAIIAF